MDTLQSVTGQPRPGKRVALPLHSTASPYLSILVVGAVFGRWAQYLSGGEAWLKGQPAGVLVPIAFFSLSLLCWVLLEKRPQKDGSLQLFLAAAVVLWLVHMLLLGFHGDFGPHTMWLVLPVIAMVWFKPPTKPEALTVLRVLGWSLVIMLAGTFLGERFGVLEPFYQTPGLIYFDENNYWLPISEVLDVDGRWPGPFSHPGDTAAYAAFLVIIGAIVRGVSRPIFVSVGILVLLLASTRAAFVATAVGLGVLFVFGQSKLLARVSMRWRWTITLVSVALVTGLMLRQSINLTGRSDSIWPEFLELWRDSPILGVGASGIAAGGEVTHRFVHGHNLLVDELARSGLLGALTLVLFFASALYVSGRALMRRMPAGAALISVYLIVSVTSVVNDWINVSIGFLIILLAVLLSDAEVHDISSTVSTQDAIGHAHSRIGAAE